MLFTLLTKAEPLTRRGMFMTCKSFNQFSKLFNNTLEEKLAYYSPMIDRWSLNSLQGLRLLVIHYSKKVNCWISLQWSRCSMPKNNYFSFNIFKSNQVNYYDIFYLVDKNEQERKNIASSLLELMDVFVSFCMNKDHSLKNEHITIHLTGILSSFSIESKGYHWDDGNAYLKETIVDKCKSIG